jgi:mannose-1-phosphate guanylyltransferase
MSKQYMGIQAAKSVLIMAGGVGSRFWPASRESKPKQFLDILGVGKSLLRLTFERCIKLVPASNIFIITNEMYAGQVAEHLPELEEDQIFLEPSRNNTAPCIAFATLKLKKRMGEGVCLVAPSDHVILDEVAFVNTVNEAMDYAASHDVLMTMGMKPTRPDTGYGYIQYTTEPIIGHVHKVRRFTEKPDKDTATEFIGSGDYLWNSGMFIWSIDAVLKAFSASASSILNLLEPGMSAYFTSEEKAFLAEYYPQTEKISVDYALMERADNVCVIPADFGWSDLGTWGSLYQYLPKDDHGNVCTGDPILTRDTNHCFIRTSGGKLVVTSGVENLAIVCEKDTVLIFNLDNEQAVKELRNNVAASDWGIEV